MICRVCKADKPIGDFAYTAAYIRGKTCMACEKDREALDSRKQKRCSKCQESKPLGAFYRAPRGLLGRESRCMLCARSANNARHGKTKPPRTCIACHEVKPHVDFLRRYMSCTKLSRVCDGCRSRKEADFAAGLKRCLGCDTSKPFAEFYGSGHHPRGLGSLSARCKSCVAATRPPKDREPDPFAYQAICKPLPAIDLTPCSRCHLRGHEAGDPDRCIQPRTGNEGLGQWPTGW